MHEAQLHDENCFLTLTYDREHLPKDGSLRLDDFQRFMKRLRKRFGRVRFFHCGEYGEKTRRPHYHALLFGFDFSDKVLFRVVNNNNLYISSSLQSLWPFGHSSIGDVTFESAAYVARYCLKKINGPEAEAHYEWPHPATGEIVKVQPEYTTMSRRPGIGAGWYERFGSECYPSDSVVIRGGVVCRPPKAYDRKLEEANPAMHRRVRGARVRRAKEHAENNTSERLRVREKVQVRRLEQLPRKLED